MLEAEGVANRGGLWEVLCGVVLWMDPCIPKPFS